MPIASPNPAILMLVAGLAIATTAAQADQQDRPVLSLDLNALEQVGPACRLVFVTTNKTGVEISELSLETVLFNSAGTVDRFALFDFQALPRGKTRVRQFDLPDSRCGDIGRVLINGVASCKGETLKGNECVEHLELKSTSSTEIIG
jgi:hypothetical protein